MVLIILINIYRCSAFQLVLLSGSSEYFINAYTTVIINSYELSKTRPIHCPAQPREKSRKKLGLQILKKKLG